MRKRSLRNTVLFFIFLNIAQFIIFVMIYNRSMNPLSLRYNTNKNFDKLLRRYHSLLQEREVIRGLRHDLISQNFTITHSLAIRLESGIREAWEFIERSNSSSPEHKRFFYDWHRLMSVYTKQIAATSLPTRMKKMEALKELMWVKLDSLNNPELSSRTRCPLYNKLLRCDVSHGCGFGCRAHKRLWCSMASLALNRTLIYDRRIGPLFRETKFNLKKCDTSRMTSGSWEPSMNLDPRQEQNIDVLTVELGESVEDDNAPFLPVKVPAELSEQLSELSENPFLLFVSLLTQYHFVQSDQSAIKTYSERIGLSPLEHYVGVHVRRTDKNREAAHHALSEYMKLVEEYYDQLDLYNIVAGKGNSPAQRKVYLATDEVNVWETEVPEYRKKGYHFFGDELSSESAATDTREENKAQLRLHMDIHFLSHSNHLVATFSSQTGRFAYELMQTNSKFNATDMSLSGRSLDWPYYYGGAITRDLRAVMANHNNNELEFDPDDVLGYAEDYHDGSVAGENKNNHDGLIKRFPHFKSVEFPIRVPYRAFQ